MTKNYENITTYISDFPEEVQTILENIRTTIQAKVPLATEAISYNMPAFKLRGKVLVYFAAFKKHIGFYALPSGNIAFQNELASYKTGKGSIQFPFTQAIPYYLIEQIVDFRVQELSA